MRLVLLLAAALVTPPLAAQAPAATQATSTAQVSAKPADAPADPAAKAAAETLLKLMDYDKMVSAGLEPTLAAMRAGAIIGRQVDANPALKLQRSKNPQAWDIALRNVGAMQAGVIEQTMKEMMPEVHAVAVDTYARNFTAQDLRELTDFYKTPLGRKVIDRLPKVMVASLDLAQRQVSQRVTPRMQALQPAIEKELAPLLPRPAQKK